MNVSGVLSNLEVNRWAYGCEKCEFGLIDPPEPVQKWPGNLNITLVYQRLWEARNHLLTFCDCPSGKNYRAYLLKMYRNVKDGVEHIPDTWYGALDIHVRSIKGDVPTIHG